jgi:hypothetical protein
LEDEGRLGQQTHLSIETVGGFANVHACISSSSAVHAQVVTNVYTYLDIGWDNMKCIDLNTHEIINMKLFSTWQPAAQCTHMKRCSEFMPCAYTKLGVRGVRVKGEG